MDMIFEKAKSLGVNLGQSEEAKAIRRAQESLAKDEELKGLLGQMQALQDQAYGIRARNNEIPEELKKKIEAIQMKVEAKPIYQQFIAAQMNFEKLMQKVNKTIEEGMKEGGERKIIVP
tara:strand:- start:322 stop:678 length:357 start_codon:yes stop_codon:yes gene_type:complete